MLVAFELKMTLRDMMDKVDQDEMGWWLAFLKLKAERDKPKRRPGQMQQT